MTLEEDLANAIILRAVKDYRAALRELAKCGKNKEAEATRSECERFFLSPWFGTLTSIDAEMLIKKLNEEVN